MEGIGEIANQISFTGVAGEDFFNRGDRDGEIMRLV